MRRYKQICAISVRRAWESEWSESNKRNLRKNIEQDFILRREIHQTLKAALVSRVKISRVLTRTKVTVSCLKNNTVRQKTVTELEERLSKLIGGTVSIVIAEIQHPTRSAYCIARNMVENIEAKAKIKLKKVALKNIFNALKTGSNGVQIIIKGRINGTPIARKEVYCKGSVPKNTFSKEIDYAEQIARSGSGTCGVKVYVNNNQ